MGITFTTTIVQSATGNATGIQVPPEVVAALGTRKNPPVIVSLAGYTYPSTIAVMGGNFMLPLNMVHRAAAGVNAGDQVAVTLELDLAPRTVALPDDLIVALAAKSGAQQAFEALAFSKRKEYVRQVEDAKTPATRERRIAGIVAQLRDA